MTRNLVVSKNAAMISFLRERYLGQDWAVTDDPDRAIEVLTKEPVDRLFLDHWLEREPKNGRDVSLWLGQHPDVNARVQVIATTGDSRKGRQMVAECGRVAYHIPSETIMVLGS